MKIAYNVTIKIEEDVHDDWFKWMKSSHIQDVMNTGNFESYRMMRLLGHDDQDGITYSIQYVCSDKESLNDYQENHAPELQKEHMERYKDKFVGFRTIMEIREEG